MLIPCTSKSGTSLGRLLASSAEMAKLESTNAKTRERQYVAFSYILLRLGRSHLTFLFLPSKTGRVVHLFSLRGVACNEFHLQLLHRSPFSRMTAKFGRRRKTS